MLAFHDDPKIKEDLLEDLRAHQEMDTFRKGVYWDPKVRHGCAVGCALESAFRRREMTSLPHYVYSRHELFEEYFGLPKGFAFIIDDMFERMPMSRARLFPVEVISVIPVGSDMSEFGGRLFWRLVRPGGLYDDLASWLDEDERKDANHVIDTARVVLDGPLTAARKQTAMELRSYYLQGSETASSLEAESLVASLVEATHGYVYDHRGDSAWARGALTTALHYHELSVYSLSQINHVVEEVLYVSAGHDIVSTLPVDPIVLPTETTIETLAFTASK